MGWKTVGNAILLLSTLFVIEFLVLFILPKPYNILVGAMLVFGFLGFYWEIRKRNASAIVASKSKGK